MAWPILITARSHSQSHLTSTQIAACIFATLFAADISYRFIEQPIHLVPKFLQSTKRSIAFGVLIVITGLVASVISSSTLPVIATGSDAPQITESRLKDLVTNSEQMQELPANLDPPLAQLFEIPEPELYSLGCPFNNLENPSPCTFGNPNSKTLIALAGDSHAAQWFQPIKKIVEKRNWKLVVYVQSGCSLLSVTGGVSEDCQLWINYVLQQIRLEKISLVILSNLSNEIFSKEEEVRISVEVLPDRLKNLESNITKFGTKMLYIADTPKPAFNIPNCLSQNPLQIQMCTFDLPNAIAESRAAILKTSFSTEKSSYIDLTEWFCVNSRCPGVIGNTLVYRDDSHIFDSYALSLSHVLAAEVTKLLKK